jgi:hypothetical protein
MARIFFLRKIANKKSYGNYSRKFLRKIGARCHGYATGYD